MKTLESRVLNKIIKRGLFWLFLSTKGLKRFKVLQNTITAIRAIETFSEKDNNLKGSKIFSERLKSKGGRVIPKIICNKMPKTITEPTPMLMIKKCLILSVFHNSIVTNKVKKYMAAQE